jgi:hypothetical protein
MFESMKRLELWINLRYLLQENLWVSDKRTENHDFKMNNNKYMNTF